MTRQFILYTGNPKQVELTTIVAAHVVRFCGFQIRDNGTNDDGVEIHTTDGGTVRVRASEGSVAAWVSQSRETDLLASMATKLAEQTELLARIANAMEHPLLVSGPAPQSFSAHLAKQAEMLSPDDVRTSNDPTVTVTADKTFVTDEPSRPLKRAARRDKK